MIKVEWTVKAATGLFAFATDLDATNERKKRQKWPYSVMGFLKWKTKINWFSIFKGGLKIILACL